MRSTLLLLGVVNQSIPEPSNARKMGWLPVMLGRVKNTMVLVEALSSPICPGGVLAEQVGAKSQPGSANHTLPALSTAVPHGSPTPPFAGKELIVGWEAEAAAAKVALAAKVSVRVEVLVKALVKAFAGAKASDGARAPVEGWLGEVEELP